MATSERNVRLDLERPPVVETSLGFYFSRVAGWNILHFGALWEKFRAKYPITEFPPPILPNIASPPFKFEWNPSDSIVPIRACFTNAQKTQLVQLQQELFLHNWRKTDATSDYQHYDTILPLFKQDWATFLEFLAERGLHRPKVARCEMSYFNHIVRGEEWQEFADLPRLFRAWRGFEGDEVFKNPELVAFNVVQKVGKGQVMVAVSPAVRTIDGKEILQLNVTGTVVPTDSEDDGLFAGLGECHEIALKGFQSFVSEESMTRWRAKR